MAPLPNVLQFHNKISGKKIAAKIVEFGTTCAIQFLRSIDSQQIQAQRRGKALRRGVSNPHRKFHV